MNNQTTLFMKKNIFENIDVKIALKFFLKQHYRWI